MSFTTLSIAARHGVLCAIRSGMLAIYKMIFRFATQSFTDLHEDSHAASRLMPYVHAMAKVGKLGPWIAERRNSLHWSQEELAAKVELHSRTIAGYEAGTSRPTKKNVRALAKVFGEDYERLLAISRGQPLPEPQRSRAQMIQVSNETAELLGVQSAEAGMSVGQYVDFLARTMESPVKSLVRALAALTPPNASTADRAGLSGRSDQTRSIPLHEPLRIAEFDVPASRPAPQAKGSPEEPVEH